MSRLNKDDIGRYFDYGLDVAGRILYMGSTGSDGEDTGTDHKMAEHVIKGLDILDRTDGPITIKMNNIGGDDYHGLAIYDAINGCKNHITLIGIGCVMSMGAWIMQAADERVMTQNASMLVHYGTWGYEGHTMDYIQWAKEASRMNVLMEQHMLVRIREKHPKYSASRFRRKFLFDSFLSAQDALDLGLIDKVSQ